MDPMLGDLFLRELAVHVLIFILCLRCLVYGDASGPGVFPLSVLVRCAPTEGGGRRGWRGARLLPSTTTSR